MATLTWNDVGSRTFETGVDRGVLFVDGVGVSWNGLISVNETPVGGESVPRYFDGVKFLDEATRQEFAATIEAYTYPEEFEKCLGTLDLANGLFARNQIKKTFNMTYRTLVGNDVDGVDHAYKLHLVFNASVEPSSRTNTTLQQNVDPTNFTWDLVAVPPRIGGHGPTAHYVIDSRTAPSVLLEQVEDILYGTDTTSPRFPGLEELLFMFENYEASVFDAGTLSDTYFTFFDAGDVTQAYTDTIDGGSP